jgi:hypothetical protein
VKMGSRALKTSMAFAFCVDRRFKRSRRRLHPLRRALGARLYISNRAASRKALMDVHNRCM